MADHERAMTVSAHPDRVFDYVAEIDHLPEYLDRMKAVQRTGAERVDVTAVIDAGAEDIVVHDEAWFRADPRERRVEWGSLRDEDDYHGSLVVRDADRRTEVAILVHTVGDDDRRDRVDASLDRALENIRDAVVPRAS